MPTDFEDASIVTAGALLAAARVAAIMVHGRNAGPRNILDLVPRLDRPDVAYLAPAAPNGTWYPFSFMAPIEQNEPHLTTALGTLERLLDRLTSRGIASERLVVIGFSQGACLSAEFAVRHARRFGGIVLFSGGLIGPPGTTWQAPPAFDGTPIFLGCSDTDAHVPKTRVDESAAVFARLGARVTERIYPGMGHLVNDDEIGEARRILDAVGC
jgi:phospholipase/carboxylesterase